MPANREGMTVKKVSWLENIMLAARKTLVETMKKRTPITRTGMRNRNSNK